MKQSFTHDFHVYSVLSRNLLWICLCGSYVIISSIGISIHADLRLSSLQFPKLPSYLSRQKGRIMLDRQVQSGEKPRIHINIDSKEYIAIYYRQVIPEKRNRIFTVFAEIKIWRYQVITQMCQSLGQSSLAHKSYF